MAKNPILPLYYNDLGRATSTWTDEEFGAYVRLLIEQWDKGSIPNDYQRLTRIATSLDTTWEVLKHKFKEEDGVLKNTNMEEIRVKVVAHREKQKMNVEKRYQNSTKQYTKLPTKTLPLEIENENEDINENIEHIKSFKYFFNRRPGKPLEAFNSVKKYLEENFDKAMEVLKKNYPNYDQIMKDFEERNLQVFWKDGQDLRTHFTNYCPKWKPKVNTSTQEFTPEQKQAQEDFYKV